MPKKYILFLLLTFLSILCISYFYSSESLKITNIKENLLEDELKANLPKFYNLKEQAEEFIEYHYSTALTKSEEKIMKDALTQIPAPCCSDYTAYTCCCDCNLARTIWGLSKYLIKNGYSADYVRTAVEQWITFTNPSGYSGTSCYIGNCEKPFYENGCGGMGNLVI